MKRRLITFLACVVLLAAVLPVTASADVGPKPSVVIDFSGLSGRTYYVTLLSSTSTTGPFSAPSIEKSRLYDEEHADYPIYLKFLEYRDEDGYYFLQYFENCSETHQFRWTYYPPSNFKILIYFPDGDFYAVSAETYDRYAFHSYFSVTLAEPDLSKPARGDAITFSAVKSYDYGGEIAPFAARAALTIAVELLIALLFAFRQKKQLILIAAVNLVTQAGLNAALFYADYKYGGLAFALAFCLLELLVFIVEAVLYALFLQKISRAPVPKWKAVVYALAANAASVLLGLGLSRIIPSFF